MLYHIVFSLYKLYYQLVNFVTISWSFYNQFIFSEILLKFIGQSYEYIVYYIRIEVDAWKTMKDM